MPNEKEGSGSCLCGSVSFTTTNMSHDIGACHCGMCRKWGGGPFMEVNCGSDIEFTGADDIGVYASSDWAERGFCKQCGSHLFYRLKETQQHMVPIGLFNNKPPLSFALQVFIDEKPDYYSFADDTKEITGDELFTSFSSQDE